MTQPKLDDEALEAKILAAIKDSGGVAYEALIYRAVAQGERRHLAWGDLKQALLHLVDEGRLWSARGKAGETLYANEDPLAPNNMNRGEK